LLFQNLAKDAVFNEWVYDTLSDNELLDSPIIVQGLNLRPSETYTIKLLQDLIERYTANAENLLVQNISNGRTPRIRATAAKAAGAIFEYAKTRNCPSTVLGALHERFTDQSAEVREASYVSLGQISSEQSIDVLLEAQAKDNELKHVIRDSLDKIFMRFSHARPSEDNTEVTIAWIKVIGKLGDNRGLELVKPYVDPSTAHPEKTVRIAAVDAIGNVGRSDDIAFLEEVRREESHIRDMTNRIDRAIALISNVGDFELLEILRKLTDEHLAFSDPKLDFAKIFGNKATVIKSQCFKAYRSWHSQNYSLYSTHLANVCDLISKRIMELFKDELFQGNEKRYVSVRASQSSENRYDVIKGKFDPVIGSCFKTVHALRVKASIAHPEDSKTEQPKAELSPEEGELAKENFINAITGSVEMLKKKVFGETNK